MRSRDAESSKADKNQFLVFVIGFNYRMRRAKAAECAFTASLPRCANLFRYHSPLISLRCHYDSGYLSKLTPAALHILLMLPDLK